MTSTLPLPDSIAEQFIAELRDRTVLYAMSLAPVADAWTIGSYKYEPVN